MAPLEEIYCFIDDFCKLFEQAEKQRCLSTTKQRCRPCALSLAEIMTILALFHLSSYRTFKDFYLNYVGVQLRSAFPKLVSYNRFLELMPYALMPLAILLRQCQGKETGRYYIDSTPLPVCHNLRIKRHKVFQGIAQRGKTSTGWFFGLKLHLVFNHQGELMSFKLTPGNVQDSRLVESLTQNLRGWLFGDKGYLGQDLKDSLLKRGLHLITRVRKNMKKVSMSTLQRAYLNKRGMIETIIDQLKALCHIQHTRHRSPTNFVVNVLGGLFAYILRPKKVSVRFNQLNNLNNCLNNLTLLTSS
jgi:hypothetical protein